jgi:hypothetical protein
LTGNIINQEIQMNTPTAKLKTSQGFNRALVLAISVMSLLLFAGCGGTKVYNVNKTIVYRDAMYGVSDVKQISAKTTGKISDDRTVNLRGADRKQVEAYIKETGSMFVRMSFDMDGQEMLYRASSVEKWSQYSSMQKSFEKAGKQIASLLAAKKTTQLKLK